MFIGLTLPDNMVAHTAPLAWPYLEKSLGPSPLATSYAWLTTGY